MIKIFAGIFFVLFGIINLISSNNLAKKNNLELFKSEKTRKFGFFSIGFILYGLYLFISDII